MSLKKGIAIGIGALLGGGGGFWLQEEYMARHRKSTNDHIEEEAERIFQRYVEKKRSDYELENYSGTHSALPLQFFEPENVQQLEALVAEAHKFGQKLRPVGRFLSPNGIASCGMGMISLSGCDKIINVDKKMKQITVEAGAVVSDVLDVLDGHNLTLQNFSSIKEQQIGGWTQVGAHGTGATLSTVDEMITKLKVVTPGRGTLELSEDSNSLEERDMFKMVRCGLGSLGIVSEVTLQCTDSHFLRERTSFLQVQDLKKSHADRLRDYRHLRYMWIPYRNEVIMVSANPAKANNDDVPRAKATADPLRQMKTLLSQTREQYGMKKMNEKAVKSLSFAGVRDELLDIDPLNTDLVKKINSAEAEFWKLSEGVRQGKSNDILGFDCGGQQWVLEVAFSTGTLSSPTYADIDFVVELKERLEKENIPAPAPIEQRWTSSSSSYMSPAYSEDKNEVFSWVGIIMYLPAGQDEADRKRIGDAFKRYCKIMTDVGEKYDIVPHWAKIEIPVGEDGNANEQELKEVRKRIHRRYKTKKFNEYRRALDPKSVLANEMIEKIFAE